MFINIPNAIPSAPAIYPNPKYINLNILTENENEKSGIENSDTAVIAIIITKIGLTILADTAASPSIKAPTIPIVGPKRRWDSYTSFSN